VESADLALAIHDLPSKPTVIVAGRRKHRLDEILAKGSMVNEAVNLHALTVDLMSKVETLEMFVKDALWLYSGLLDIL